MNGWILVVAVPGTDEPGVPIEVLFADGQCTVAVVVPAIANFRRARIRMRILIIAVRAAARGVRESVCIQILVFCSAAAVVVDAIAADFHRAGMDACLSVIAVVAEGPSVPIPVHLVMREDSVTVRILSVAALDSLGMDLVVLVVAVLSSTACVQVPVFIFVAGIGILQHDGVRADPAVSPENLEISTLSPSRSPAVLGDPGMFHVVIADQEYGMASDAFSPHVFVDASDVVEEIRIDVEGGGKNLLVEGCPDGLYVVRDIGPVRDAENALLPVRTALRAKGSILPGIREARFIHCPGNLEKGHGGSQPVAVTVTRAAGEEKLLG
jgi:hypothetical protein